MALTPALGRTIGLVASVAIVGGVLAACGGSSTSSNSASSSTGCQLADANTTPTKFDALGSDKVTISFMETMVGGSLKSSLKYLVDEFQAANPNITVQLQESPDYGTLKKNITNAVQSKTAPTIAQSYESWADDFANNDVIESLNNAATSDVTSTLYPGVVSDMKLCDGNTWMFPFNKSVYVNYYNQNMLQAKGLTEPKTWDEFASSAKSVSGNGVTAIAVDPGGAGMVTGGQVLFQILAEANGTPVFDKNGTPQFTSAAAKKAMNYLLALKNAGALTTGSSYPGQLALGNQKGAFDLGTVAGFSYEKKAVADKFTLGVGALPAGPSKAANQINGTNIVLFKQATAQQKAAAIKFMTFLNAAQQQAYWAQNTGYLPTNTGSLALMSDFVAKNPWLTAATSQLNTATPAWSFSWADKAQGEIGVALSAVLNNGKSVDDALAAAQAGAEKALKDAQ
jgi:ABC-type glycerol-3-phosphate transport system substrate-binding protein